MNMECSTNARPLQNSGILNETASRLRLSVPTQRPRDHIGQDGRDRTVAVGTPGHGIEPPILAQHVDNVLFFGFALLVQSTTCAKPRNRVTLTLRPVTAQKDDYGN
jgi:hypothetical protein